MSEPDAPRTADQIAQALMSAYLRDAETSVAIYPTDHAGIVKLYQQDKWLRSVRAWMESDPQAKARFDGFMSRQKQGGQ